VEYVSLAYDILGNSPEEILEEVFLINKNLYGGNTAVIDWLLSFTCDV
jgi:hypothetical protein